MNIIKIKKLVLQNFKGAKSISLSFENKETFIHGDNGTCKTTISDAINYLLRGKNSKGEPDTSFSIKPLDENNNEIHRLSSIVDATIDINGVERKIKKDYHEIWGKSGDPVEQIMKGHTTDYYIDDIKRKTKKQFDSEIEEIMGVSQNTVVMLSNPMYFLSQIHWSEKRKTLCDIAGEVNYSDIITLPEFNELSNHFDINIHDVETFKKHCKTQLSMIETEKVKIPTQLGVLDSQDAEINLIDFKVVESEIEELKKEIISINEQIKTLTDSTAKDSIKIEFSDRINKLNVKILEIRSKINSLESQKELIVSNAKKEIRQEIEQSNSKADTLKNELRTLTFAHDSNSTNYGKNELVLSGLNSRREKLRKQFADIGAEQFDFLHVLSCSECGKSYTEAELSTAKENAENSFKEKKQARKDSIQKEGIELKEKCEKLEKEMKVSQAQGDELFSKIIDKKKAISEIEKEIASLELKLNETNVDTKEIDLLVSEHGESIKEYELCIEDLSKERDEKIKSLSSESTHEQKVLLMKAISEKQDLLKEKEIIFLKKSKLQDNEKDRQKYLAAEKELNEKHQHWSRLEHLITMLIREYVSRVEDSVNKMFKLVKFKLFKDLQNGGQEEVCVAIVDGVPDGDINTAKYINAGIDIINALSEHYQTRLPIIIDNRESITEIIETESQIINLVKDKQYKVLTLIK